MEHWDGYVFASHLTPKQHVAVANLVDKKCKVLCLLNGVPVKTLLGHGCTGIHCVEKLAWRLSAFLKVKEYCRLRGEEAGLNLIGANGGLIPFDGWVEVQSRLTSGTQSSTPLTEPLLFARGDLEYPMIGYVIEEVIESPDQMEEDSAESLGEIMSAFHSSELTGLGELVLPGPNGKAVASLQDYARDMTCLCGQLRVFRNVNEQTWRMCCLS